MSLLGIDKWILLLKIIRKNGGIRSSLHKLFRFDTLKDGKLVGWDTFGNKYYENNYYMIPRNRYVEIYNNCKLEYDASMVTAEWYGWLHHKTDRLPCEDAAKQELFNCKLVHRWLLPHEVNYTGTDRAYYPYSTVRPRICLWDGPFLGSHIVPVTWRHFIYPALILCCTARSISPSPCSNKPKYLNSEQVSNATPSSVTATGPERPPKSQHMYSVFDLLIFKPTFSIVLGLMMSFMNQN